MGASCMHPLVTVWASGCPCASPVQECEADEEPKRRALGERVHDAAHPQGGYAELTTINTPCQPDSGGLPIRTLASCSGQL